MIQIILDTSGSMVEDSKHFAAIYLLQSVKQCAKEKGIPVSFYRWQEEICPLGKISEISWTGSLNPQAFLKFFQEKQPILLISDGDFPDKINFKYKTHCHLLYLGEDYRKMQTEFSSGRLWFPENLLWNLSNLASSLPVTKGESL